MEDLITQGKAFFDAYGLWIAAGSIAMFVISLASIPFIVARIPVDYFHHHHRHRLNGDLRHPLVKLMLVILKNILGAILLVAGFIMLFTPGQGLLAILFGLMIMNYPGKYRLECWIIGRPMILSAVNNMREKHGQPPLIPPESS
ncbi:Putative transmembrane protein (PGPGW) [Mariprofundus ferrinatatus]|uniref:Transmembrane protein (PGPGW) n=1 Tax=Mariprofundus ferrinatatus TaxID=1921087 RepID=A0A2K8L7F2_9PROT|nr:PGPGW domain-containing protein [Mariprofundus ferrinatatus]ATX83062.1 Putative transmembrane protein (PGPGW) [Mariprofundus ferrinatatus]